MVQRVLGKPCKEDALADRKRILCDRGPIRCGRTVVHTGQGMFVRGPADLRRCAPDNCADLGNDRWNTIARNGCDEDCTKRSADMVGKKEKRSIGGPVEGPGTSDRMPWALRPTAQTLKLYRFPWGLSPPHLVIVWDSELYPLPAEVLDVRVDLELSSRFYELEPASRPNGFHPCFGCHPATGSSVCPSTA